MNPWEGLGYLLHQELERYKKNPDPRRLVARRFGPKRGEHFSVGLRRAQMDNRHRPPRKLVRD
jgi:hypothetical protein